MHREGPPSLLTETNIKKFGRGNAILGYTHFHTPPLSLESHNYPLEHFISPVIQKRSRGIADSAL